MRRSSRFLLAIASLVIAGLWLFLGMSQGRASQKMDEAGVDAFLKSGQEMLKSGDTNGIMNLFAPGAKIMGASQESLNQALISAMEEMNGRPLTALIHNVSVNQLTDSSVVTFDIDIEENQKGASIHYFSSHVNLTLEKVEIPHWLGIYRTSDWKITQMDAQPSFGLSDI
jgi:hypothetical protein